MQEMGIARACKPQFDISVQWYDVKEGGIFARMVEGDIYTAQPELKTIKDWQYLREFPDSWIGEAKQRQDAGAAR